MAQESSIKSRGPIAAHPVTSAVIAILVIAAIFFSLYVPLYARATPMVGDFPFFYFYLLIFMPITSVLLWLVTQLQKRLHGEALDTTTLDTTTLDTTGGER